MKSIILKNDSIGEIKAVLLEEKAPKTCKSLWKALPLSVDLLKWGEELYGTIPIKAPAENAKEECEIGDIAYWLEGSGFCILFGPTRVSTSEKPKLISPGNVFAKLEGDPMIFKGYNSLKIKILKGD